MFKRFGIPALALASALAIAAPTMSFARDRAGNVRGGNQRGSQQVARADFRGRGGDDHFDRDRHFDRDDDDRFNYGLNFYAPPPAPAGYYDQYGIWHPYAVGGQYGVSGPYGY